MFFSESNPKRAKKAGIKPALSLAAIPPAKSYELFDVQELLNSAATVLIFDVESYPNYFLVSFKDETTGKVIYFERTDYGWTINGLSATFEHFASILGFIIHRHLLVGFNSKVYDLPMVAFALDGLEAKLLKDKSDELIFAETAKFDARLAKCNHIDIIDVAPISASLKIYSGRLHCQRMQDLPYQPNHLLSYEEACQVRDYNVNDLDNTSLLYQNLKPQIELRIALGEEYQQDLRSKSDAQVAEAVILGELAKQGVRPGKPTVEPGKAFRYRRPPGLAFQTEALLRVLETVLETDFIIGDNGSVNTPEALLDLNINVGKCRYQLGNGGLHSQEKSVCYFSTENTKIIDRDVASYYPAIMLNQNLYPAHLGEAFINVYRSIRDRRLQAKSAGRKTEAEGLKIAVNGGIGKLSNQYSKLYAPEINTQVTVSGQLYLLMLIEALELCGIEVISANTDGVVSRVRNGQRELFEQIIAWWESQTGFITEETCYNILASRDVNNYIAVKDDGKCKTKGVYSEFGSALNSVLSKNPESLIVSDAVQKFLAEGKPYADTIRECRDIRRFINVRTVKGGAQKNGQYLGKAIRWYYSKDEVGVISYVQSGNNVPKSEKAKPCMDLPDGLPADLDFDHYINEALETLYDIGFYRRPKQGDLW